MVSFALELSVSSFTHVGAYITLSIETRNSVNLWSFAAILACWGGCSWRESCMSPAEVMNHTDLLRTCHFGGSNLAIYLDRWFFKLRFDIEVIGTDWTETIYKSWLFETWQLFQALWATWQVETWPDWKALCDKLRLQLCGILGNCAHTLDSLDSEGVY